MTDAAQPTAAGAGPSEVGSRGSSSGASAGSKGLKFDPLARPAKPSGPARTKTSSSSSSSATDAGGRPAGSSSAAGGGSSTLAGLLAPELLAGAGPGGEDLPEGLARLLEELAKGGW